MGELFVFLGRRGGERGKGEEGRGGGLVGVGEEWWGLKTSETSRSVKDWGSI